MPGRKLDRRLKEIMLGLVLLTIGLAALGSTQWFFLGLGMIGLVLLARQFAVSGGGVQLPRASAGSAADAEDFFEEMPAQPRADQVYAHALDAVRNAKHDPAEMQVLPIDIGVMAFTGDNAPVIYRTRDVLDDVDYVQPFVQLRLPTKAKGRIRFEITDADGQVIFRQQEDHNFERGRNLIMPAARLPIRESAAIHGEWRLAVYADGVLIADHPFGWEESTSSAIRRNLTEDGELSGEIREMIADNRLERMSLDELLSEQDTGAETPEAPKQQGRG